MTDRKPLQLRLPPTVKAWLEAEAAKTGASMNSEVVRIILAEMDRRRAPDPIIRTA